MKDVVASDDVVLRFLLGGGAVRGAALSLSSSWQTILSQQEYPDVIAELLGQAIVSACLWHSLLNWSGTVALQIQGGSAFHFLIAECRHSLPYRIRGTAQWHADQIESLTLKECLQGAYLSVVLDPGSGGEVHRSLVSLDGHDSIASAFDAYMKQSAQIPTCSMVGCSGVRASGVLIQRLPERGGTQAFLDQDAWPRVMQLLNTLSQEELREHTPNIILHRLFSQEAEFVSIGKDDIVFSCQCSREKAINMLSSLNADAFAELVPNKTEGTDIHCDYCNTSYFFDVHDLESICYQHILGHRHTKNLH